MSSENIKNLVRQAQCGNAEAFGKLYSIFAEDMFRFAFYHTSSKMLAEDAVGDAVLLAFQKIKQLKKSESFKNWQFKILLNCCRKQQGLKAISLKNTQIEDVQNELYIEPDYNENIELKKALQTLTDEEREIFLLSNLFGYSSKEIGEITELKSSTVRSKNSRTTEKIRNMLLEEGAK